MHPPLHHRCTYHSSTHAPTTPAPMHLPLQHRCTHHSSTDAPTTPAPMHLPLQQPCTHHSSTHAPNTPAPMYPPLQHHCTHHSSKLQHFTIPLPLQHHSIALYHTPLRSCTAFLHSSTSLVSLKHSSTPLQPPSSLQHSTPLQLSSASLQHHLSTPETPSTTPPTHLPVWPGCSTCDLYVAPTACLG